MRPTQLVYSISTLCALANLVFALQGRSIVYTLLNGALLLFWGAVLAHALREEAGE